MRIRSPRFLFFPLVLMLAVAIFVACGTAAAPTAVPSQPESPDTMTQDGDSMSADTMTGESMEQDGEARGHDGDSMGQDAMEPAEQKMLVDGWYRDHAVEY